MSLNRVKWVGHLIRVLLCLAIVVMLLQGLTQPTSVYAGCGGGDFPSVSQPINTYGIDSKTPQSNEPVNLATGDYTYQHQDLFIIGRGLPLKIERTYNSGDSYDGPFGRGWTFNYNVNVSKIGNMESIVIMLEDGYRSIFKADIDNYLPPYGRYKKLVNTFGGSVTLFLKDGTSYMFDLKGKMNAILDNNSNVISFEYDENGNLTKVIDPSKRILSFSHDSSGRITGIADWSGRTWKYVYDAVGNLVQYVDPMGNQIKYAYDNKHCMTSIIDALGRQIVTNIYNDQGQVVKQIDALGSATSFNYDKNKRSTTETDQLGYKTVYAYDIHSFQTGKTDALGNTTTFSYDNNGNRNSITDANGHMTRYEYDKNGNVIQIVDSMGNAKEMTYDSNNNLTSLVNSQKQKSIFEYDKHSNLIKYVNPAGKVTTFDHDIVGQLSAVTLSSSSQMKFSYNKFGNCTSITDALGNSSKYDYDDIGNLIKSTDANGNSTSYTYDSLNQLVKVVDALGGSVNYKYDTTGNMISMTDANSHTTNYKYDNAGNLIALADALGNTTTYSYNSVGNRISVVDANGRKTNFAYDALNRISEITYSDNSMIKYGYDPIGNIISIEDQHGVSSYQYNALGFLTNIENPDNNTISYIYDSLGNRTGLTYPNGKTVNYSYDLLNRLAKFTGWNNDSTEYSYNDDNNLIKTIYPNNTSTVYSYDKGERLQKIVNSKGIDLISSFEYSLDAIGNRVKVIEKFNPEIISKANANKMDSPAMQVSVETILNELRRTGSITTDYQYDKLNRLSKVAYPANVAIDYKYDPMGNRTSMVINAEKNNDTVNYTYDDCDRLIKAGYANYSYDANGSLIEKSNANMTIAKYSYDPANRLIRADLKKTLQEPFNLGSWLMSLFSNKAEDKYKDITANYECDAVGNRISKSITSDNKTETNHYIWDIASAIPQVLTEENGNSTANYIRGNSLTSMVDTDGVLSYYYADGLCSIRNLTNNKGNILSAQLYDPFGQPYLANARDNSYLFAGEQMDNEGLIYLRARYYDPGIGRFIAKDPFAGFVYSTQNQNRYSYANNNPICFIDPSGYCSKTSDESLCKLAQAFGKYGTTVINMTGFVGATLISTHGTASVGAAVAFAGAPAITALALGAFGIGFAVGYAIAEGTGLGNIIGSQLEGFF